MSEEHEPEQDLQHAEEAATSSPLEPIEEPFFIIDEEPADEVVESESDSSVHDELDGLRIRHVSHLRRANIRSQTYGIVCVVGFGVAAVKLILMAYSRYTSDRWSYCVGCAAAALAAMICAIIAAAYVDRLREELRQPRDESDLTPDFDLLSDGSHHAQNLEDMVP